KVSLILLKHFPASYRENLALFSNDGYTRVPSMPATKLELRFANFDEYMEKALSKVFRKNLRRKFRNSARFADLKMEVCNDLTPFVDEVHPLYLQVLAR